MSITIPHSAPFSGRCCASKQPSATMPVTFREGFKVASYIHHSFYLTPAQLPHSLAKCDLLHQVNDVLVPHVIVRLLT